MKTNNVYFYNLTVRFKDRELLDLLDSFVLPAFFSGKFKRNPNSKFLFMNCFVYVSESDSDAKYFIAGRFVKQMRLYREQVVDGQKLKHDYASIESAPSFFFLLNLETHVISVLPETSGTPSVREFCSLLKSNMLVAGGLDERLRAKELIVKGTPFQDTDGFRENILDLKVVKRFEIRSSVQNSQHHLQDLLKGHLNGINETGSIAATTKFQAGEKTSSKDVANYIAVDDLRSGGATAKITGKNRYDADSVVESDNFLHAIPLRNPPPILSDRAAAVDRRFQTAVTDDIVRPISDEVKERVRSESRTSLEKYRENE